MKRPPFLSVRVPVIRLPQSAFRRVAVPERPWQVLKRRVGARARRIRSAASTMKGLLVRLAVFGVICLVLMGWLIQRVGNISFLASGPHYRAQLSDASGLSPGDNVKVAGITVGKVDSVSLQHGHALVRFEVDQPLSLTRSTDVGMQWHDVLGAQDLYLYPGAKGTRLRQGATIPLSHDVTDASVAKFLNDLGPFLTAINPQQANAFVEGLSGAIAGDDTQIDQLIGSTATVSSTLGSLNGQIGSLVDNLATVISALASKNGDIDTVVSNLSTIAQSLASRNGVLEGVVTNLSTASQEFGGLVGSNQHDLSDAITNLNAILGEVSSEQANLAKGISTLGSGLAPYIEISSYGQWFQIQTVYACMGGESECNYYMPNNAPNGTPPVITGPGLPQVPSAPAPPGSSSNAPSSGNGSIPGRLQAVAGGGGAVAGGGGGGAVAGGGGG